MKAFYYLALGAVMFYTGGTAEAQTPLLPEFDTLDSNKDGYVSIIEATGQVDLLRKWIDLDSNTDGQLEMSEFSAFESNQGKAKTFDPEANSDDMEIGAGPSE